MMVLSKYYITLNTIKFCSYIFDKMYEQLQVEPVKKLCEINIAGIMSP